MNVSTGAAHGWVSQGQSIVRVMFMCIVETPPRIRVGVVSRGFEER